jgi:ubiquinone/menaquinone biosynthesis C-methylase UbiE
MSFDWDAVWDRKGSTTSDDHLEISGFESFREIDTEKAADALIKLMGIEPDHLVFEIGTGAGLLGRHLKDKCIYIASDRSPSMVAKTIALNNFQALRCDAIDLPFKDKYIDHVFAFGVFHYFPSFDYGRTCLQEMERVARRAVCVSDIPTESHDSNHLLFKQDFFPGYSFSSSLYPRQHHRFTATRYFEK